MIQFECQSHQICQLIESTKARGELSLLNKILLRRNLNIYSLSDGILCKLWHNYLLSTLGQKRCPNWWGKGSKLYIIFDLREELEYCFVQGMQLGHLSPAFLCFFTCFWGFAVPIHRSITSWTLKRVSEKDHDAHVQFTRQECFLIDFVHWKSLIY